MAESVLGRRIIRATIFVSASAVPPHPHDQGFRGNAQDAPDYEPTEASKAHWPDSNTSKQERPLARQINHHALEPLLNAARQWIDTCLVGDGSLFAVERCWRRPKTEPLLMGVPI
jgi:hypothetical protein